MTDHIINNDYLRITRSNFDLSLSKNVVFPPIVCEKTDNEAKITFENIDVTIPKTVMNLSEKDMQELLDKVNKLQEGAGCSTTQKMDTTEEDDEAESDS